MLNGLNIHASGMGAIDDFNTGHDETPIIDGIDRFCASVTGVTILFLHPVFKGFNQIGELIIRQMRRDA